MVARLSCTAVTAGVSVDGKAVARGAEKPLSPPSGRRHKELARKPNGVLGEAEPAAVGAVLQVQNERSGETQHTGHSGRAQPSPSMDLLVVDRYHARSLV